MTYVSRKTRIILSGRSDECSAEFIFQAFRRRSDGRLKNYSSCDDVRAWINDNCVKNEYLQDYMSKSEFLGDPPFALYGRFIPVPILFKILQNGKGSEEKKSSEKESEKLSRVLQEKNQAEKNLLECTCLLNTAIRKLEKLNNIIETANSESERARAKEIKNAFRKSKEACTCSDCKSSSLSSLNNCPDNGFAKNAKDTHTYNELMRKISQLKKKLNEVQTCRCQIMHQIRKAERCPPSNQVKELFNREDQNMIKELQKDLEKLIAKKGKLLSEMCHVLNSLNALKISSRGNFNSRKGSRSSDGTSGGCSKCKCGCKVFDNYESTDTENADLSDATYVCDEKTGGMLDYSYDYSEPPERLIADCGDEEPERLYREISCPECEKSQKQVSNYASDNTPLPLQYSISSQEKSKKLKRDDKRRKEKTKKSKVKFICDSSPCSKKIYHDDLSGFENSLTAEQKAVISKAVKNLQRPSTTPTTKREKREMTLKSESSGEAEKKPRKNPLRRAKSDTRMNDLEKTFKNYERRLNNVDSLECKVEYLKQKSAEVCQLKKKLTKVKAEAKRQRAAEKERFSTEITRLCSENWELKKHLQQLTAEFETQCKRVQILKCGVMKARELECETEELKKELSEYRDGFEHQRKCISKWENVVAMQRTEIENLMNHIRKLTAENEEPPCQPYQEKKYIQRSRSYSPEVGKEKPRVRRKASKEYRMTSEEEENCCCGELPQLEGRKKIQPRSLSRACYPPPNESILRGCQRAKEQNTTETPSKPPLKDYQKSIESQQKHKQTVKGKQKMEEKDNETNLDEKYRAQITELKAQFLSEKEELTSLFLEKLKEVENYHKKMLQDLVIKSSSDLDAIQAKHDERVSFMMAVHVKELEGLQTKIQSLQSDKEELKKMLIAICEGQVVPKEKLQSFLRNGSEKTLP